MCKKRGDDFKTVTYFVQRWINQTIRRTYRNSRRMVNNEQIVTNRLRPIAGWAHQQQRAVREARGLGAVTKDEC